MTKDSRKQPYYFEISDFKEATKHLDRHYVSDQQVNLLQILRDEGWRAGDAEVVDAYWGKIDGNAISIGARAKMMALCWLNNFLPGSPSLNAIAHAIADCEFEGRVDVAAEAVGRLKKKFPLEEKPDRYEREKTVVWAQLSHMISGKQGRHPYEARDAEDYIAITAGYYAIQLRDNQRVLETHSYAEIFDRLMQVIGRRYEKPSHCARELARELGLDVDGIHRRLPRRAVGFDFNDQLHFVDESLEEYARDRKANRHGKSSFGTQVEELLRDATRVDSSSKRLFLLSGKEHAGKKAFVGELIGLMRDYEEDTETTCLSLYPPPKDGNSKLPVFAVNTREADYLTLMIEIIVFLEQYKESALRLAGYQVAKPAETFTARVKREKEKFGSAPHNFDELLKRIATLHAEHPAFFVFLDVHGSLGDSILKIINNYGIVRLLKILLDSNKRSRILVTDPAPGAAGVYEKVKGKRLVQEFPINPPTIERLLWYRDEPAISNLIGDLRENADTHVEGCALVGLAALYSYEYEGADYFEPIFHKTVAAASAGAKAGTAIVFHELLLKLQKHRLLEPFALICAAEDGCWDTTLLEGLKYWPGGYAEADQVISRLTVLKDATNKRLVKDEVIVRPDREEWAYDEKPPVNQWIVSQDIARAVFTAMHADEKHGWRKLARQAHRLIAIAARRRAQTKKMRDGFPVEFDRTAEARDIQSYVALLSSIDPADIKPRAEQLVKSLRLASESVFTTVGFDATTALRYAIRCLLREDIDYDFRLSMVTDQDELRLRLYLLPFCLGRPKQFWSISKLRKPNQQQVPRPSSTTVNGDEESLFSVTIPSAIPGYFREAFTPREILEHLVTVSLTGFHCQFPKVIRWAYDRANELGRDPNVDTGTGWWVAGMSRIRSSLLDMEIQRGGIDVHDIPKAKRLISRWLHELKWDRTLLAEDRDVSGRELDIAKGWMRIRAREAEIEWLTGQDRSRAKMLYDELWDMEERLADSIDQDDPIVLSGRTARRYVRFLMHEAPIYSGFGSQYEDPSGDEIRDVRQILDINISRLRRFSGADRVGVLIDMARRHHEKEEGLKFAELALKLTFAGTVSHGGKLDVLSVSAALNVLQAEHCSASPDKQVEFFRYIDAARDAASLLSELAGILSFWPATATSHYLLARIAFAQFQSAKAQGGDMRAALNEAESQIGKAMKAAGKFGGVAALRSMEPLDIAVKSVRQEERAARSR